MSGAWVRRATLQAADGAPMPTKQTSSFDKAREAAIVIISTGVKSAISVSSQARNAFRKSLWADPEYVFLHPSGEEITVGGNLVPFEIGGVVAPIVAVRV